VPELTTPGRYTPPPSHRPQVGRGCLTFWRRPEPDEWEVRHEVCGVTVVFKDPAWYVPPHVLEPYYRHIASRFAFALADPLAILEGGTVFYTPHMSSQYHGLTRPRQRVSLCRASLIGNVDEHEISLWFCEHLFPGRGEGEDIEWMAEHGVTWGAYEHETLQP